MRALSYHEIQYTPDMNELIEYNKKNMTICLPDLGTQATNPSAALAWQYGCQFEAMSFQNFDQKANQLYNLMSSVLKATNEMRSGTVRNML